ncbi:MAG: fibronectin type III domain-containing protein [Saprospiraceae bacterium]
MPKIVSFLLLLCLAGINSPLFSSTVFPVDSPSAPTADDACTLAAPANLVVTEVGTTYISVAWDPVSGASKYRVKVKDLTTGIEVSDQLVSGTTFTQNGLTAGDNYRFRVYSVCSNDEESTAYAELEQSTIIIDLILEATNYNSAPQYICSGGYSPVQQPVTCTFNYQTGYAFWLEVRAAGTSMMARYKAVVLGNGDVRVGLVPAGAGNYQPLPNLSTVNQNGTAPVNTNDQIESEKIFVLSNGSFACQFTMAHHGSTGFVYGWPSSGYEFKVLNPSAPPSGGGGSGGGGISNIRPADQLDATQKATETGSGVRDDGAKLQKDGPTLVVNPFSASLDVYLPASDQPVRLRLFSPDGRLVARQTCPAGTTLCSLPAEALPDGFYLLSVEKAGEREVFKVVKRE